MEKNGAMSLTLAERRPLVAEWAPRYQVSSKTDKSRILNEFMVLSGLTRKHASALLTTFDRKARVWDRGRLIILQAGTQARKPRSRKKDYDPSVLRAPLTALWDLSGNLCSRRLHVFIQNLTLSKGIFEHLNVLPDQMLALRSMSAATIDRILRPCRIKWNLHGRSHTRPGRTLLTQIPIVPYYHQNFREAGFLQVDLVSHDGGNSRGEYCFTLTITDPATTWTVCYCLLNKAHRWVIESLEKALSEYPFPVRGIHSDSGSEFVNDALFRWCRQRGILLSRSRPNRKNDNCYVEQKNDDVVRKTVGYIRYEGFEDRDRLNELYAVTNLIRNFHTPSMKIFKKERHGSRVRKTYDRPMTPVDRVLESELLTFEAKARLQVARNDAPILELRRRQVALAVKILSIQKGLPAGQIQAKNTQKKTYRLTGI